MRKRRKAKYRGVKQTSCKLTVVDFDRLFVVQPGLVADRARGRNTFQFNELPTVVLDNFRLSKGNRSAASLARNVCPFAKKFSHYATFLTGVTIHFADGLGFGLQAGTRLIKNCKSSIALLAVRYIS
jgi:hypothetical protein